jgi:HAMP domain-containing protein
MRLSSKIIAALLVVLAVLLVLAQHLEAAKVSTVVTELRRRELTADFARFKQQLNSLAETRERVAVAATRLAEDLEREHRAGIPINADERAAAIATWLLSSSPAFVLGVGIYFEPNVFGDVRWVGPYAARGADGAVSVTREYANDAYNYPTQSWYAETIPVGWDRAQRLEHPLKTTAPYVDSLAGQPTVFQSVVHAIHSSDGHVRGVVSVDSSGGRIDEVLGTYRPTPSSSAFLVDERGLVVFPRVGDQLQDRSTLPFADRLPWHELEDSAVVVVDGLTKDGHTFAVHLTRIRGNAILGVILATDEAYGVLNDVRRTSIASGLLTLLAVAVVVALVVRRLLRPLAEMTTAAQRVAAGDLSVMVASTDNDEIGVLGRAFAGMVHDVQARDAALNAMAFDAACRRSIDCCSASNEPGTTAPRVDVRCTPSRGRRRCSASRGSPVRVTRSKTNSNATPAVSPAQASPPCARSGAACSTRSRASSATITAFASMNASFRPSWASCGRTPTTTRC